MMPVIQKPEVQYFIVVTFPTGPCTRVNNSRYSYVCASLFSLALFLKLLYDILGII